MFPWCPPININPQTVYNHMDAVIMCWDWDPDPPNILESDKVTFFKLEAVAHSLGRRLFSGGKFPDVSVQRADGRGDLEWVNVFCRWQMLFSGQKCEEELVGQAGGQTGGQALLHIVFSSYKLPKTVTVTTLLLFGHLTLPWGKCLFY